MPLTITSHAPRDRKPTAPRYLIRMAWDVACQPARSPRLRDHGFIPAHVKNQWRIVDLLQLRRVSGIIQSDDSRVGGSGFSQFILRHFHGVSRAEGLR
jgi:hypothetical protein